MKNNSLMQSIVKQQCPGCKSKEMFADSSYSKRFIKMHKKCPNCSQSLEPEPGFYTGAMYVSYAFQVAIIIAVITTTNVLGIDGSLEWYIGWISGLIIAFFPTIYRLSRSIWAHALIPFRSP